MRRDEGGRLCYPPPRRALADRRVGVELMVDRRSATPFMRHEYLAALHDSGSATAATGWQPCSPPCSAATSCSRQPPALPEDAFVRRYVFDWAWADAYQRHGLAYYPQLLGAVPFTPVPGARCWRGRARAPAAARPARDRAATRAVVGAPAVSLRRRPRGGCAEGWLLRATVQFHWQNPAAAPTYPDFAAFLATPARDKRKKIQQERRRVAEADITFRDPRGRGHHGGALGLLLPLLHPHLPERTTPRPISRATSSRAWRRRWRATGCFSPAAAAAAPAR